jgi:membrane-associated phospholipid phosphatase
MINDFELRWNNLNAARFRHLRLLVFWPVFSLLFWLAERGITDKYYIMYTALDDLIPFCEYFLIPYLFWFVYLAGMVVYTLLFDVECFVKLMKFIIITYSAALVIYFLFPTAQELRPAAFERNNFFTGLISGYYDFDTNTNVCPSLHVTGSLAAMFAAWNSRHFYKMKWKIVFSVTALLICMSTVFLKQHSILDVFAALIICVVAYPLVYRRTGNKQPKGERAYLFRE